MTGTFKFSSFQESLDIDYVLRLMLNNIRPDGVPNGYWSYFTFTVDKIAPSVDGGITNYWVRCKGQRKEKAVILQSNWRGMEMFTIEK